MARKAAATIEEFDPERVRPMPGQPRKRFSGINELAASIEEIGQASPGIVTLVTGDPKFDAQLVDGERRLRACRKLQRPFLARVTPHSDEETLFAASFGANFGRQDHDVVEVAQALARMQRSGRSIEQICRIAGKSDCWVYQHLNLLKLHADVLALMVPGDDPPDEADDDRPGLLSYQTAQLLVPLPESEQIRMARKIVNNGMSVVAARRMVLNIRMQQGETNVQRGRLGPNRLFATLESVVESATDRLGVYVDMPGAELNRLIDGADARSRRLIIERVDDLVETLEALAEAVRSRLPKVNARSN